MSELEIEIGYKVNSYMEDYRKLVAYLELKYSPYHKFSPNDFYEALNRKIPKEFQQQPNYKEVIRIAAQIRKIEENEKIYFCGWKRNTVGKSVSDKNYEKTLIAFGEEKA